MKKRRKAEHSNERNILQCGGSNLSSIIIRHLRLRRVSRFPVSFIKDWIQLLFTFLLGSSLGYCLARNPLLSFSLCLSVQMRFKSLKTLSVQPLYVPGTGLAIRHLSVNKQDRSTSPFFLVLIM